MRSACPPIMYGCKYLNFSRSNSDMELLARKTVQELEGDEGQAHLDEYADASTERGRCMLRSICEKLGFDSLGYQSLDGLLEAIGIDRDKICTSFPDGKAPLPRPCQARLLWPPRPQVKASFAGICPASDFFGKWRSV